MPLGDLKRLSQGQDAGGHQRTQLLQRALRRAVAGNFAVGWVVDADSARQAQRRADDRYQEAGNTAVGGLSDIEMRIGQLQDFERAG
ncbi:hypothetical protein IPO96_03150 [Candidatus Saccharibacteria bacterium]|nr:MAG: hypothetical protein IPO96_03150 [Candidatus Saccharibacteria bacterium]